MGSCPPFLPFIPFSRRRMPRILSPRLVQSSSQCIILSKHRCFPPPICRSRKLALPLCYFVSRPLYVALPPTRNQSFCDVIDGGPREWCRACWKACRITTSDTVNPLPQPGLMGTSCLFDRPAAGGDRPGITTLMSPACEQRVAPCPMNRAPPPSRHRWAGGLWEAPGVLLLLLLLILTHPPAGGAV